MGIQINILGFCCLLTCDPVLAEPLFFSGNIQITPEIQDQRDLSKRRSSPLIRTDLRLISDYTFKRWSFNGAVELQSITGRRSRGLVLANRNNRPPYNLVPLTEDRTSYYHLSHSLSDHPEFLATIRIDRAFAQYHSSQLSLRVGRQPFNWGEHKFLPVLDLINPISPYQLNQIYKTGEDAISLGFPHPSGDDLEFTYIPRRSFQSENLTSTDQSYLLRYTGNSRHTKIDYSLLLGKHNERRLWGWSIKKDLWDCTIRSEFIQNYQPAPPHKWTKLLIGIDRDFAIGSTITTLSSEYFHQGLGVDRGNFSLNQQLREQISKGETFTTSHNYLGLGLQIQPNSNTRITPKIMTNLDDKSSLLELRSEYDILPELALNIFALYGTGQHDSEFGGYQRANSPVSQQLRRLGVSLGYFF